MHVSFLRPSSTLQSILVQTSNRTCNQALMKSRHLGFLLTRKSRQRNILLPRKSRLLQMLRCHLGFLLQILRSLLISLLEVATFGEENGSHILMSLFTQTQHAHIFSLVKIVLRMEDQILVSCTGDGNLMSASCPYLMQRPSSRLSEERSGFLLGTP